MISLSMWCNSFWKNDEWWIISHVQKLEIRNSHYTCIAFYMKNSRFMSATDLNRIGQTKKNKEELSWKIIKRSLSCKRWTRWTKKMIDIDRSWWIVMIMMNENTLGYHKRESMMRDSDFKITHAMRDWILIKRCHDTEMTLTDVLSLLMKKTLCHEHR